MKIHYISGRCGSGKTYQTIKEIVSKPQRTVLAVDRVEAMLERINMIKKLAKEAGTEPTIDAVHSKNSDCRSKYEVTNVGKSIEGKAKELAPIQHVILLVTHKSMMSSDWSSFKDWSIVIDEAPAIVEYGVFGSAVSKDIFKPWYKLEPSHETSWARVRPTQNSPKMADMKNNIFSKKVVEFHEYITSKLDVYVNFHDWESLGPNKSKWTWLKVWNPESLLAFDKVLFLANDFRETIAFKIINQHFPNIQLIEEKISQYSVWDSRNVVIEYSAEKHFSSTHYWDSSKGRGYVKAVVDWISSNTPEDHIFTSNHSIAKTCKNMPGQILTPRQHGSNKWSKVNICSIIYSNKPDYHQKEVFNFFNITKDEVTRAYEGEDIIQFCFRTSLRNPNDSSDVTIRVYDKSQADFLADYLNSLGYINASTKLISEVGISQIVRKRGRPQKNVTNAQKSIAQKNYKAQNAKAQQKKRQEKKEEDIRNGIYKGPGRPRKNPIIFNTIQ